VYWALGLGLIPAPLVDVLALTGVQVKMLKELSELYGVKFFDDKARAIVGSLIAGLGGVGVAGLLARSLFKLVPGLGALIGAVGSSVFGGALTLATGSLFAMHYEAGGTLLTFDPAKMRDHFRREFESSQHAVKHMQAEQRLSSRDPESP
jgi:uncharacterized protein (DUF697 family)